MTDVTVELPGDLSAPARAERMIRVDHAGEYGAARIYAGQLAVLGRGRKGDLLRHMEAQEQEHLRTFKDLIADRRVRPTVLLPLWHVAGFALGAVTAVLGERAAMACTVAVEETIDAHYSGQIHTIDPVGGVGAPRYRPRQRRGAGARLSAAVADHQDRMPNRYRRQRADITGPWRLIVMPGSAGPPPAHVRSRKRQSVTFLRIATIPARFERDGMFNGAS